MEKHEEKTCPRCGGRFICRANHFAQCDCATVQLPAEVTERIAAAYSDCLCVRCLRELSSGGEPKPNG